LATVAEEPRRSVPRMVGDFLREAAVLVIVFYPLERYFRVSEKLIPEPIPVRPIIALSLLLLVMGMALEKIDFGAMALRCINIIVDTLGSLEAAIQKGRGPR
jgi:uncharacterized membrane protein